MAHWDRVSWMQQPGTDVKFMDCNDVDIDAEDWFLAFEKGYFNEQYTHLENNRWVQRIVSAQSFNNLVLGQQSYETIFSEAH